MKKLLLLIIFIFSAFTLYTFPTYSALNKCDYDVDKWIIEVWTQLDNCLNWSKLVSSTDVKINWWFWIKIKTWTNNIALYLWILAVWSIVFGSLMMTLSAWEDEKIKKAKDVIKWGIIWFLWIISASWIITIIVKLMYSI